MPKRFVSTAGYRSPRAPPVAAAAAAAAPPAAQEPAVAWPIEAAEQRDAEWLATLDANDRLIENLAARVRALPRDGRQVKRVSAPT